MSYFDGASSSDSNSSWQVRGCPAIPDSASDRTSIRSGGDDLSGASGVITPAQAYVRAVKTGQVVDRTRLQYTIERSQQQRRIPTHLSPPLQSSNSGSNAERGASYAQRLYASAVASRSSTHPSTLSVERPIAAPSITTTGPSPFVHEPQHRRASRSPTSPDSERVVVQPFNAGDFYSVSRHENSTRTGLRRPPPSVSDLRTSTAPIPAPHSPPLSAYALPLASHPQSSTRRDMQPCDPAVASRRTQPVLARPISPVRPRSGSSVPPPPSFRPPSVSHERPAPGSSSSLRTPTDVVQSRRPSVCAQASVVGPPPPTSPPPFDAHEESRSVAGPEVTPIAPRPSLNLTHHEALQTVSPHEAVPLYSLIDETQPPPSFDDIQPTVSTAVPTGPSSIAQPEMSLSMAVRRESASAGSSSQALDVKVPPESTSWGAGSAGCSAASSSTAAVPQRLNLSPPVSPPMSPEQTAPSYGMTLPSSHTVRSPSRTPSALSSRSAHNQSTNSSGLSSLGAYAEQPVDQARRAGVVPGLTDMQSGGGSLPPLIGVELNPESRTAHEPSVRSADVDDTDGAANLTHAMANLMGESTSRFVSHAEPEYEEAVVEESSRPGDGNASSEAPHFTGTSAPPPYCPGVEGISQEGYRFSSAETTATGAQGQPYQGISQGCAPTFHVAGAQQAPVDTIISARPRDEPRGRAVAVGPPGRSELGRPQTAMQPGSNVPLQHAPRSVRPGAVIRDEDVGRQGTFPPQQQQKFHPQAQSSSNLTFKGPPDVGNAVCLPTQHMAGYCSKVPPPAPYARDTTIHPQIGPMNTNELARKFAQDALLGSMSGTNTSYFFHRGDQR